MTKKNIWRLSLSSHRHKLEENHMSAARDSIRHLSSTTVWTAALNMKRNSDVLLTVHLSIFISVINQIDAQGGRLVHETATCRCDDTRGCVMQFWPPDEHMCSKHVEAWNKLIVKQKGFAWSWLITEITEKKCSYSERNWTGSTVRENISLKSGLPRFFTDTSQLNIT